VYLHGSSTIFSFADHASEGSQERHDLHRNAILGGARVKVEQFFGLRTAHPYPFGEERMQMDVDVLYIKEVIDRDFDLKDVDNSGLSLVLRTMPQTFNSNRSTQRAAMFAFEDANGHASTSCFILSTLEFGRSRSQPSALFDSNGRCSGVRQPPTLTARFT